MTLLSDDTYILMYRKLLTWRWFQEPKTLQVWIWLLLNAYISDHEYKGYVIHRGEIMTSRKQISYETGLTEREVRTALNHLKSTGEVSVRLVPKKQVISILRYDEYQASSPAERPAGVRQKSGKSPASDHYINKNNKTKKKKEDSCGDTTTTFRVPPLREEVADYCRENGISTDVDAFMRYNDARGWKRGRTKVADWKPLLAQWVAMDKEYGRQAPDHNDGLDDFGRPIRKEFE